MCQNPAFAIIFDSPLIHNGLGGWSRGSGVGEMQRPVRIVRILYVFLTLGRPGTGVPAGARP
jgi:hypothetical protein